MGKRKIILLSVMFIAIASFALSPVSAASKTIDTDFWNYKHYKYNNKLIGLTFDKKVGNYKIKLKNEYTFLKHGEKKHYKNIQINLESKKKFKSATFYMYNTKTHKFVTKYTLKPKKMNKGKLYKIKKDMPYRTNNYVGKIVIKT